jgi:methylated-DNA-[protein]-cysteine S-methyltransferase
MIFDIIGKNKYVYFYESKVIGIFGIVSDGERITNIIFGKNSNMDVDIAEIPVIKKASNEIFGYFDGKIKKFSIPIKIDGTPFQKKVWNALLEIPFGEVRSYKQIAETIGCAKGYRAIGMANGKNKIPILIPCHRIICSNGSLGGYTGGIDIKRKLLEIEGNVYLICFLIFSWWSWLF